MDGFLRDHFHFCTMMFTDFLANAVAHSTTSYVAVGSLEPQKYLYMGFGEGRNPQKFMPQYIGLSLRFHRCLLLFCKTFTWLLIWKIKQVALNYQFCQLKFVHTN